MSKVLGAAPRRFFLARMSLFHISRRRKRLWRDLFSASTCGDYIYAFDGRFISMEGEVQEGQTERRSRPEEADILVEVGELVKEERESVHKAQRMDPGEKEIQLPSESSGESA